MVNYLNILSNSISDRFLVILFFLFFLLCIISNFGDYIAKSQKWKNRLLVTRAVAAGILILIFFQIVLMVAALRFSDLMNILGNYYFLVILAVVNYIVAKHNKRNIG